MGSRERAKATLAVLLDTAVKLLVFLSVTFLFYEVFFGREASEYHLLYRFAHYLRDVATFDVGLTDAGVSAWIYIGPALRNSALVFLPALLFSVLIAYALGVAEYLGKRGRVARAVRPAMVAASSIPIHWIAILLFLLAINTGWFPIGGTASVDSSSFSQAGRLLDRLHHLVLPWASLMLFAIVFISAAVSTRVDALADSAFVRNARALGLTRREVLRTHLRAPLIAEILNQTAYYLPLLVTYLVLLERVFLYPGLGYHMVEAYGPTWWTVADLTVSRAALQYVGLATILIQFLARLARSALLPTRSNDSDRRPIDLRRLLAGLAALVAGVLLTATLGGAGTSAPLPTTLVRLAPWVLLALFAALSLTRRARGPTPAARSGRYAIGDDARGREERAVNEKRSAPRRFLHALAVVPASIWVGTAFLALVVVLSATVTVTGPHQPWQIKMALSEGRVGTVLLHYLTVALARGGFILFPLAAAAIGTVVGTLAGVLCGHQRVPAADWVVSQLEVFPSVLILVLVSGFSPESRWGLVITLSIVASLRMYRIAQHETSRFASREFIQYGAFLGRQQMGLLVNHYLPATWRTIVAGFVVLAADLIVLEANLSYLGRLYPRGGWSILLVGTKSDFVRGEYLPALFPVALLVTTIVALRMMARRISPSGEGR